MDKNVYYKNIYSVLNKGIEDYQTHSFSIPDLSGLRGKVYAQVLTGENGKKRLRLEEVYSTNHEESNTGYKNLYIRGYVEAEIGENDKAEVVLGELKKAVSHPVIATVELDAEDCPKPAKTLAIQIERADICLKVTFLDIIDRALTIYKEENFGN